MLSITGRCLILYLIITLAASTNDFSEEIEKIGKQALSVPTDVTDSSSLEALGEDAIKKYDVELIRPLNLKQLFLD